MGLFGKDGVYSKAVYLDKDNGLPYKATLISQKRQGLKDVVEVVRYNRDTKGVYGRPALLTVEDFQKYYKKSKEKI